MGQTLLVLWVRAGQAVLGWAGLCAWKNDLCLREFTARDAWGLACEHEHFLGHVTHHWSQGIKESRLKGAKILFQWEYCTYFLISAFRDIF